MASANGRRSRANACPVMVVVETISGRFGYISFSCRAKVKLDNASPTDTACIQIAPARSATGFVVEALRLRRAAGIAPFTVVSCDNLPANGQTLRRVALRHAGLLDPDLGAFIAGEVAFPSTMVDRIVPATTAADIPMADMVAAACR